MNEQNRANEHWIGRYPPAAITPAEFEQFVAELLQAGDRGLANFAVTPHERIEGVDGVFEFDVSVRYRCLGMDFLVLVEAKFHSNPVKRELVQVLWAKAESVGAHKAVLISTSPFQRGAINFAKVRGIALVTVTEGRFTYATRAATDLHSLSRIEAAELFGLPTFVGIYCQSGADAEGLMDVVVGSDDPRQVQELLLAVPPEGVRAS